MPVLILALVALAIWNRRRVKQILSDMQLSRNFDLSEFVVTQTGLDNIPDARAIQNLQNLTTMILQPLRDAFGKPLIITSGYRSPLVNAAVGGAETSQHKLGEAADFYIPGISNSEIIAKARELHLPYDQIIDEHVKGKQWVHVSFRQNGRREWMTARTDPHTGRTMYNLISIS